MAAGGEPPRGGAVRPESRLLGEHEVADREASGHQFRELALQKRLHHAEVAIDEEQPQRRALQLDQRRHVIAARHLDPLGVERRPPLIRRLVRVPHVSFLRLKHARQVHLLEFQRHRRRVIGGDGGGNLSPDSMRALRRRAGHVDEERVRVAVHHLAFHREFELTVRIARSSVSRPHCTMASASSAIGMRPLYPAAVYPYVTLAMSFKPNCRAFSARRRARASRGAAFSAAFTITRVSKISVSNRGRTPGRTDGGANIAPLLVHNTPGGRVAFASRTSAAGRVASSSSSSLSSSVFFFLSRRARATDPAVGRVWNTRVDADWSTRLFLLPRRVRYRPGRDRDTWRSRGCTR